MPVLVCPLIHVPMTLGAFRPRILLPPDWVDWSVEKLNIVLIHEQLLVDWPAPIDPAFDK